MIIEMKNFFTGIEYRQKNGQHLKPSPRTTVLGFHAGIIFSNGLMQDGRLFDVHDWSLCGRAAQPHAGKAVRGSSCRFTVQQVSNWTLAVLVIR